MAVCRRGCCAGAQRLPGCGGVLRWWWCELVQMGEDVHRRVLLPADPRAAGTAAVATACWRFCAIAPVHDYGSTGTLHWRCC